MAVCTGPYAVPLLKALGIKTEQLIECDIRIRVDEIVSATCKYALDVPENLATSTLNRKKFIRNTDGAFHTVVTDELIQPDARALEIRKYEMHLKEEQ